MSEKLRFLAVILLRSLIVLMSRVPLWFCHMLGIGTGFLLARFPNEIRRITGINLDLCFPHMDERERQGLIRDSLSEFGKTLFEIGALWHQPFHRLFARIRGISGEAELEAALETGRGVIVAGPHLGAWELLGLYLGQRHRIVSLYRPLRLGDLDDYIRCCRERSGALLVPVNGAGVRRLNRTLKKGGIVGILPDQYPKAGARVFVPFFGVSTATMTLLPRLAARTGAAVFLAWAERLPRGRGYYLHFIRMEGIDDPDLMAAGATLNRGIEREIGKCPQQYLWAYNRFKSRPDGTERHGEKTAVVGKGR